MHSTKLLLIAFVCSLHLVSQAKILIFTYSYNRPDFIELQNKTFKKFLKDDYEFVVFNDARDPKLYKQIKATCKKLHIKCIKIPQEIHTQPYLQRWPGEYYHAPAVRNCNVVMYSLDNYGFKHDDIVVLLDSDMFLVKPFSIREYMNGYDLAGLLHSKSPDVLYLWIGLVFLNMRTMPNKKTIDFNCGKVDDINVDAGGQSYHYLKNNPDARVNNINLCHLTGFACEDCNVHHHRTACKHNSELLHDQGFNKQFIQFIQANPPQGYYHDAYMEFLLDRTFLHYRSATNWDGKSTEYHKHKTKILHDFITAIIS